MEDEKDEDYQEYKKGRKGRWDYEILPGGDFGKGLPYIAEADKRSKEDKPSPFFMRLCDTKNVAGAGKGRLW